MSPYEARLFHVFIIVSNVIVYTKKVRESTRLDVFEILAINVTKSLAY